MSESERKVDQLRLLHETGADTPMGQLLRSSGIRSAVR